MKVRFAPSPTGFMHLGNAITAIRVFSFGKKNNATILFRLDDTDIERSKQEYKLDLEEQLKWLGFTYDYKIIQSDRMDLYEKYFKLLYDFGYIYECFENEDTLELIKASKRLSKKAPIITKEDCKEKIGNSYWRFELPNEKFTIKDEIFDDITYTKTWSDPIVKKSDGSFTYIFVSIVDDIVENITHILRGADHLTNTLIQYIIGNAILSSLNGEKSLNLSLLNIKFMHFPLWIKQDGSKVSKRTSDLSIKDMRKIYEPETLWSVLYTMGTNNKQIISKNLSDYYNTDLVFSRSLQKMPEENYWLNTNKKILRLITKEEVIKRGGNETFWKIMKNNIKTWHEFMEISSFIPDKNIISKLSTMDLNAIPKESYKEIYLSLIGKETGPNLKDLIQYFIGENDI